MRKTRLAAMAVTAALTLGVGPGVAAATTNGGPSTPSTPTSTTWPGWMNDVHDQMIAGLPADLQALCTKYHNQMIATGTMPMTGTSTGHMGTGGHMGSGGMMSGATR